MAFIVVIPALLLALLIRTFVVQPFSIPSGSGAPTLLVGDDVFAAKYAYGYSRFSFPLSLASFPGRILSVMPERGDVVVFRLPKDQTTDYVKRIVGLPGDRIQMVRGELVINGQAIARERLADVRGDDCGGGDPSLVKRWKETLPNGRSWETLDCLDGGFLDDTPEYTVPAGNFFMLGDNRDNSVDSRMQSQIGYIPFAYLIGRVDRIYYSVAEKGDVRRERIGMAVR